MTEKVSPREFRADLPVPTASVGTGDRPTRHSPLVIEGGVVIDGCGGPPLRDSVVVIQGDRITDVGARGRTHIPTGAVVFHAEGKYVVPGLIDAKCNYASNFGEALLNWGVTSAIVSGGSGDAGIAERDAINHGMLRGPRLFFSYSAIGGPGPDGKKQDSGIPGRYSYVAHSAEEAREISQYFLSAGADFLSALDGDGAPEIFRSVVEEAHRRGKAAAMRAIGPQTAAREIAEIGYPAVLIHTGHAGIGIAKDSNKWKSYAATAPDPYADMDVVKALELITLLVKHRQILEPDLIATGRGFPKNWARVQRENSTFFDDAPALKSYFPKVQAKGFVENVKSPETYLDPEQLELRAHGFKNHIRFLKMYVDAGGQIVAASDNPQSPPGIGLHQEMAVFEEDIGLTPMQVIQSATSWTAEAFMLKDLGVIAADRLADILIVNEDPTRSVLNLRQIDTVIKGGEVVDRTYSPDYLHNTFRVALYRGGTCCFSSPVVEQLDWLNCLKRATWDPSARNGGYSRVGGLNCEMGGTPGIESIYPYTVPQGSRGVTLTVRGFNFNTRSQLLLDGKAIAARVLSRTEIQAALDQNIFLRAGKFTLRVKNPDPISTSDWGDRSNVANLLVPYAFTTTHSRNRF